MSANTYGRAVVLPMTNKSGGSVAAGDVVIYDSTTNDSFTTTTSAASLLAAGIAQETIASNAVGRVLTLGYAALVNTSGSVTRLNFGATHTVAKQAADVGSSRASGTFMRFLSSGATPDAVIYPVDLAGAALTNPMTTKGDVILGDTGGTPTRLAAGATAGMVLTSAGSGAFETFSLPPGYQFDHVEQTSATNITATTEATANTIVTGSGVAYDGSTSIMIEFFTEGAITPAVTGAYMFVCLYDGSSSIGLWGYFQNVGTTSSFGVSALLRRKLTPSNATHTYSVRGFVSGGTGSIAAGAGGAATNMPVYIRITKV